MRGQRILDGIFRARALISILVLGLVILDIAFFVLSFGPFRVGALTTPVPLSTLEAIEAAVAIGGLSLAYATMVLAESTERQRRFETYPSLSLRVESPVGKFGDELVPGRATFALPPSPPAIGVMNVGKGPASRIRTELWYKKFDYATAVSAEQSALDAATWEKADLALSDCLPLRLASDAMAWIGVKQLVNLFQLGGKYTHRPTAVFVRVDHVGPDGDDGPRLEGGVKLVSGSLKARSWFYGEIESAEWIALPAGGGPRQLVEHP